MCSYHKLCVVKKKEENNSGAGYEDGQYPLVLYNRAVLRHEMNDEITLFRLLVRLQQLAHRSNRQESRYKTGRVFNDIDIRCQILYGSFD